MRWADLAVALVLLIAAYGLGLGLGLIANRLGLNLILEGPAALACLGVVYLVLWLVSRVRR